MVPTNTTLAAGTYTATIPIQSTVASNNPQNITVTYTVTGGSGAPSISNLAATLAGLNGCTHSDGSRGNLYSISFSYSDPTGAASFSGSIVETFLFTPSNVSGTSTILVPSTAVTVSNGVMTISNCLTFGTDVSMSFTITLQNSAAQASNQLAGSLPKPAGGASTGRAGMSTASSR
jgi:hypothetical protein